MQPMLQDRELTVGIGLRAAHMREILKTLPEVSWFEVLSENYMAAGGRALQNLDQILEHYRVVQHGVGLYLGSAQALNASYLRQLKSLVSRTKTPYLTDHLCWGSVDGKYSHDLLPLPYCELAIRTVVENLKAARDYLEVPIAVENVSSYAAFADSTMTEWQFLSEVAERADCGILLDVNNIYVSSLHHGFDCRDYLAGIPLERVVQMHLAGHRSDGGVVIDTHDHPVAEPVWQLYARAIALCGPVPTLLEWDARIPPLSAVLDEAAKATRYWPEGGVAGET